MANKRRSSRRRGYILSKGQILVMIVCVAVLAGIAWMRACNRPASHSVPLDNIDSLMLVRMPGHIPSQPVSYEGMTLSFNAETHTPNWVAWELTRDETYGSEPRYNKFLSDPDVEGCATPRDYSYSGYDRGHMAPAGDMKWDPQAMRQTFYLTNICPQAKALNTGAWKRLEEKCRVWAQADSAIVIICGPVPGDAPLEYIGSTRVAVPARFFKVILSPYADPPRAIGFIMPNERVEGGLQKAAVSVDRVEALTGYDFFASLPDSIEADVESRCEFNRWSNLKPSGR